MCYSSADMAKNPAAVALGRLGGRATAERRTPEEKRKYAKLAGLAAAEAAETDPEAWRAKTRKGGLERAKRRAAAASAK